MLSERVDVRGLRLGVAVKCANPAVEIIDDNEEKLVPEITMIQAG